MITVCPYCGHYLPEALNDGVASCTHCCRVFPSSAHNALLSAAWLLRQYLYGWDRFLYESGLSEDDARLVWRYISDEGYSVEEFRQAIKAREVA